MDMGFDPIGLVIFLGIAGFVAWKMFGKKDDDK